MGCGPTGCSRQCGQAVNQAVKCSSASNNVPGEPGDPFRGISVHYLETEFINIDVCGAGFTRDSTIYDIECDVIRKKGWEVRCPRDGRMGCAFVDTLGGEENAGRATAMLSCTWDYAVGDIVDTLSTRCKQHGLDPKSTYVWICCLCVNQHRVQKARRKGHHLSPKQYARELNSRLKAIGTVYALMEPWDEPRYITRIVCVHEFYMATSKNINCTFEILMPPREVKRFQEALVSSTPDQFLDTLPTIQIQNTEASLPEEKERILKLIKQTHGRFNLEATKRLQLQYVEFFNEHVKSRLQAGRSFDTAVACAQAAGLFRLLDETERAKSLLEAGHSAFPDGNETSSLASATILGEVGAMAALEGNLDVALMAFKEAQNMYKIVENLNPPETAAAASLLVSMGCAHHRNGDLVAALQSFNEAQNYYGQFFQSTRGAVLFTHKGTVQEESGDSEGALESYKQARSIRKDTQTLMTPAGAELLLKLGDLLRRYSCFEGALAGYAEARRIHEAIGTLETPDGAFLLWSTGVAEEAAGNPYGALGKFQEARRLFQASGSLMSSAGQQCLRDAMRLGGNKAPPPRAKRLRASGDSVRSAGSSTSTSSAEFTERRNRLSEVHLRESRAALPPTSLAFRSHSVTAPLVKGASSSSMPLPKSNWLTL